MKYLKINIVASKIIADDELRMVVMEYLISMTYLTVQWIHHWHNSKLVYFSIVMLLQLLLCTFKITTLKRLQYSYWGITFFQFFSVLVLALYNFNHVWILYLSIIYIVFQTGQSYTLSSPVFYPRVRWWEYDFRYRGELRVIAEYQDEMKEARLTDLRRGAGCLQDFRDFSINENIKIRLDDIDDTYFATLLTKRDPNPGRGYVYGVRFKTDSKADKVKFQRLNILWSKASRARLRRKFSEQD
jgi:hypothetical protein